MNSVRAHFIARGTFLHHWARAHGFRASTVTMALQGHRRGRESRRVLSALRRELGAAL